MTHRLHQTSLILSHKYIIHNILSDTAVTSVTTLSFSDYWHVSQFDMHRYMHIYTMIIMYM